MSQPLFAALFDETERRPLTVSQLTDAVRGALEARFTSVWVEGEISNFKAHSSGHWYFSLKDEGAQLRAKCFRSSNTRIRFRPQDGLHVRARGQSPFFKIVLLTNASGLDLPVVQYGLKFFTCRDEIWAKLDAGTQAYMDKINRAQVSLEKILANILLTARKRAVVIQSLFPSINGQEPPPEEIEAYAQRLKELKDAGAQISLVQIYSATRPTSHSECGHLPLRTLSRIARRVREVTGLKAEVF